MWRMKHPALALLLAAATALLFIQPGSAYYSSRSLLMGASTPTYLDCEGADPDQNCGSTSVCIRLEVLSRTTTEVNMIVKIDPSATDCEFPNNYASLQAVAIDGLCDGGSISSPADCIDAATSSAQPFIWGAAANTYLSRDTVASPYGVAVQYEDYFMSDLWPGPNAFKLEGTCSTANSRVFDFIASRSSSGNAGGCVQGWRLTLKAKATKSFVASSKISAAGRTQGSYSGATPPTLPYSCTGQGSGKHYLQDCKTPTGPPEPPVEDECLDPYCPKESFSTPCNLAQMCKPLNTLGQVTACPASVCISDVTRTYITSVIDKVQYQQCCWKIERKRTGDCAKWGTSTLLGVTGPISDISSCYKYPGVCTDVMVNDDFLPLCGVPKKISDVEADGIDAICPSHIVFKFGSQPCCFITPTSYLEQ